MVDFDNREIVEDGENGLIEDVMVSRVGDYVGSSPDGGPVEQTVDAESLQAIADGLNASGEELLCDVDHSSSRSGLDRDTRAAGWFSRFVVDPLKGLFARLKLTKRGRELVEGRDYRFLSPSFLVGEDGKPKALTACSLTNTPAMYDIDPILNQKPEEEKIDMEISREELVTLIKETVAGMKEAENACSEEEKPEETPAENACAEETKAENACAEETKAENAEATEEIKEEIKEEVKEEVKEETETETEAEEPEDKEEEEVIKAEALCQKPVAFMGGKADWENLHGQEFWSYLAKHPELTKNA